MKWGVALLFAAAPVWAETGILEITAGRDQLQVAGTQVLTVALESDVVGPRVVVTLDPALAEALRVMSAAHLREEVMIKVCGVVVSQPELWAEIPDGVFAIQGDDYRTAQHLAEVLQAKDCAVQPLS
jgi:preprotein translocase subunit SecD